MRVVLATANAGKLRELKALLAPRGLTLLSQAELGVTSAAETGTTFEENALLKARHAAYGSGLPALADDSGLEVDALGGRPGVHSARYAGEAATDAANCALLLRELLGFADADRGARYRCVIAMVRSAGDPSPLLAAGAWDGRIAQQPAGHGGFGYDPLFIPSGRLETVAQMPDAAKNAVSHRALALQQLLAQLR
ncbi:MAG TPA: RdgB/HAM1 family non-canonical purine NTP pyrophosphatase [Steroidobacteraceae bacterium]|nr:RdgB/HAM1 family non-canonical purine NTP pyrophosphatase [Steroidobacteraceae bacterium]